MLFLHHPCLALSDAGIETAPRIKKQLNRWQRHQLQKYAPCFFFHFCLDGGFEGAKPLLERF